MFSDGRSTVGGDFARQSSVASYRGKINSAVLNKLRMVSKGGKKQW